MFFETELSPAKPSVPSSVTLHKDEQHDELSAPRADSPAAINIVAPPPLINEPPAAVSTDREIQITGDVAPIELDSSDSEGYWDSKGRFSDFTSSLLGGLCAEGDPYLGVRVPIIELRRLAELRMPSAEPGMLLLFILFTLHIRHPWKSALQFIYAYLFFIFISFIRASAASRSVWLTLCSASCPNT